MPKSLSDINVNAEAQPLISGNLVSYSQDAKTPMEVQKFTTSRSGTGQAVVYNYQLCAAFKKAHDEDTYNRHRTPGYRPAVPSSSYHPAGKVCYDLQTRAY
jgi:hypothetical protein